MTLIPLTLPPGIYRNGTKYQTKGRWYDANFVRWIEGTLRPVGGWQRLLDNAGASISVATKAAGTLTSDATNVANGETVTIDTKVYTFQTTLTNVDGNVKIGASAAASLQNLYDAINLTGTPGTQYATAMTLHPTVSATAVTSTTVTVAAKTAGTPQNAIATTETSAHLSWGATTLAGGATAPRGMHAWRAANGDSWLGLGTAAKLYAYKTGTLTDITPAGLVTGRDDATQSVGTFGGGNFGAGVYGQGASTVATTSDPTIWQLDAFGQFLVGVLPGDGKCYSYNLSGVATQMSGSPTGCTGIVVTPERFIFALGAGGDGRTIQWPDQGSQTVWTPASTNQAGSFTLSGDGILRCGRRGRNETLLWTDVDLWTAQYIGPTLVYSFRRVAENCGIIGPNAVAMIDGRAIWMGQRGFFQYNGIVAPLPCEISDYIFSDFNAVQKAKVTAVVVSQFGEVWFFYCSQASTALNRYVIYNYRENHWSIGQLDRCSGVDAGVFANPVMAHENGFVYLHESSTTRTDEAGLAYAESGPQEIGSGEQVMMLRKIVPDEKTLGDTRLFVYTAMYPNATETENGPFTSADPTDVRLTARQARLRVEEVNSADWRVGTVRFDAAIGGKR